jgi:hypothetical protein
MKMKLPPGEGTGLNTFLLFWLCPFGFPMFNDVKDIKFLQRAKSREHGAQGQERKQDGAKGRKRDRVTKEGEDGSRLCETFVP